MSKREEGHVGLRLLLGCVLVLGGVILTSGQQGEVLKTKGGVGEPPTTGSTTGTTTGTTGTTGPTGTTGTTGSTSGNDGTGHTIAHVKLLRLEERLHQNSAWLNANATQTSTDRHALRLKCKTVYVNSYPPGPGPSAGHSEGVGEIALPAGSVLGGLML